MSIKPAAEAHLLNAFASERSRLTRLLTRLCGREQVAEDLVQETLTEAWLNRHKLYDPQGCPQWLTAIAYNIHRRWLRQQQRVPNPIEPTELEAIPQAGEVEVELERAELAHLLDQAIALLPSQTRAIFIQRYIEGRSQAQVAEQLKLSQNAVAVRLHRGKLTLRRLLAAELERETDGTWQETRLWCGQCGTRRMLGHFDLGIEEFILRCPSCDTLTYPAFAHKRGHRPLLQGVKGFKPALNRLLKQIDEDYNPTEALQLMTCGACGQSMPAQKHFPKHWPDPYGDQLGIYEQCPCGAESYTSLKGLAIATPTGRAFWRKYPRLRSLPVQQIEYEGQPTLVVRAESVNQSTSFAILFARDTYQILDTQLDE